MAKGFTMIELVIVIIIMVVVAAVSYVKLTDRDEMKLHGASRKLASDIRYAQSLAIARRTKAGVVFDTGGNSYSIFLGNTSNIVTDPMDRRKVLTVDFDTDSNLKGVELSAASFEGTKVLAFDPMGVPLDSSYTALSSEGQVIISFQGMNDTVRVGVNTGRVRVDY